MYVPLNLVLIQKIADKFIKNNSYVLVYSYVLPAHFSIIFILIVNYIFNEYSFIVTYY